MRRDQTVTAGEAQANAQEILRLWRAGRESRRFLRQLESKDPDALRYRRKEETFAAEARRLGTNVDKAAKMRRVAGEYTREQIDAVCALVREHRSRFSPTHLLALLRLEDRGRRDRLSRQAIRGSWTSGRLERAVQAERGRRRQYVGRKPYVPSDPAERLLALDALAEKWCRWCDAASPHLPERLRELADAATRAVRRVQTAVEDRLGQLDTDKGGRNQRL